MLKDFVIQYWVEVGFGLVVALFSIAYKQLSKRIKDRINDQDVLKLGVQALLRDRIVESYNKYTEKGHCPIYAMENIQAMYAQYHVLGGNGAATNLLEKLEALPTNPVERK